MKDSKKIKRPGRKKLPDHEARKHQINCRLTDTELDRLNAGKPEAVTQGEWLRTKALSRKLPRAIPEINRQSWADLARSLGNLNQITKHLNQGGGDLAGAVAQVEQIRVEIQDVRSLLLGLEK